MKKSFLLTLSLAFLVFASVGLRADEHHLLPQPQSMSVENGTFKLNRAIKLELPSFGASPLRIKETLTELITNNGGSITDNASVKVVVNNLYYPINGVEFQEEAYNLSVRANIIEIEAMTPLGVFRAVQTLTQLAEGRQQSIVQCRIQDFSAWRVRGWMHDCGRSYLPFDKLKEEIIKLAYFKVNVFHWHLTDNQGWRLESKIYPELNQDKAYDRHPRQYYTIEQAKELIALARSYGITVIPEIDIPGHSKAFRNAFGHSMLTEEGLKKVKAIINEAATGALAEAEWLHIGTDEVRGEDLGTMDKRYFIPYMTRFIHQLGKKIVSWNPGEHHAPGSIDMTQMWSSRGRATEGVPAIDSRYHYINHFDQYADIVGLYKSNICKQKQQDDQYAGVIIGIWNDRNVPSYNDIINQNAFYASMLAMAERAWLGGGEQYFEQGGVMLDPNDKSFADWEKRFLFHKKRSLKNEPIAYVKQTNIKWLITDAFPNGGNTTKVFPPEANKEDFKKSYQYNNKTYNTKPAVGAGIYLRHVWGTLIPAFYENPQANATAYAYTMIWSPIEQEAGAQIGFHDYGRSEPDLPPKQGTWDYNDSKIWFNGKAIEPPVWKNTHTSKDQEVMLQNENFCTRPVVKLKLKKGWNKVLIKLPNHGFGLGAVRLVKWMFTFALTTTDGREELKTIVYDPEKKKESELTLEQLTPKEEPSTTAVETLAKSDVRVYPNPCTDKLYVENVSEANVYALDGTLVAQLKKTAAYLDVRALSSGAYFLQSLSDGAVCKFYKK